MATCEEIVVSGVAGRFPECENVEEFWKAIFEGADLLTVDDRRFPPALLGTSLRIGRIPHPEHFDSQFFGLPPKIADFIDPRQRVFLEVVYECLVDAGYNPKELRGSKTGVYVGITSYYGADEMKTNSTEGYSGMGTCLSMCPNRTSFAFDFRGPSIMCDTACSSSLVALSQAINDMRSGKIDYAVIGGTQLNFDCGAFSEVAKLHVLSPDGNPRPYSSERNGYVRSEAVVAVFLQRKNTCRRIYAIVEGAHTNCDGYKEEGINHPSYEAHSELIKTVFNDNSLDPNDVTYFEGHGTGTRVGDAVECRALAQFFCSYRTDPLLLGSVKSNMGHSEISAGICSLAKILGIMKTGIIPATINCEPIDPTLDGVKDGKIIIVSKNTPFKPGLVAMSSMGYGGANAHVVVKPHPTQTNTNVRRPRHRLVLASGRTAEAVDHFLDGVLKNQDDQEFLALVDEIHKVNIDGHYHRGFVVLGDDPIRGKEKFSGPRPIWFVYTGVGCQWISMGKDLMRIEVFKRTFDRCALALKPYDIDLHHIVTTDDDKIFDDRMNFCVGILSIQIALTDLLYHLGIYPDAFVGHSQGEMACAYVNGEMTPEQAILLAYGRGFGSRQVKDKSFKGAMAAIGLPREELARRLPEGIYIACENSANSITISGPEDITRAFVEKLNSEGVFAGLINTANHAFHTKYVEEVGKYYSEFITNVLQEPQLRSPKWISTSLRPEQESEHWSRYNSPEYHFNNFCGPVLFKQIYDQVPENAIVIEIGPHGLLQSILKRSLPETVTNISLLSRDSKDTEHLLLSNIGRLYLAGCQPNLRKLYPDVQFPVSSKATTISPLVKWDHSSSWSIPEIKPKESFGAFFVIDIDNSEWSYLQGHEINGRVLMPAASYLLLVWHVFANLMLKTIQEVPVVFERLSFNKATILVPGEGTKFRVNILTKTGNFEIFESGSLVTTGKVKLFDDDQTEFECDEDHFECNPIAKADLYKHLKLLKYHPTDLFSSVMDFDLNNYKGSIRWHNKFDCFLESMIHLKIMDNITSKEVLLPTFVERLVIDPISFLKATKVQTEIAVKFNKQLNMVKCEGIEICGIGLSKTSAKEQIQAGTLLEIQQFVHYNDSSVLKGSFRKSTTAALEIILQNSPCLPRILSICEIESKNSTSELSEMVREILAKKPFLVTEFTKTHIAEINEKFDVLLITDHLILERIALSDFLHQDGFVIYRNAHPLRFNKSELNEIFSSETASDKLYLLKNRTKISENYGVVNVNNAEFTWIDEVQRYMNDPTYNIVYLLDSSSGISGVIGLTNSLNKEPHSCKFRLIMSDETFATDKDLFKNQLEKRLVFNILRDDRWGTYVYLPHEDVDKKEVTNASVEITTVGNLASLAWVQSPPVFFESQDYHETVHIFYSALNFKDIMLSTGKMTLFNKDELPTAPSTYIGLEFSGLAGNNRVMGINSYGGISLQHKALKDVIWEIPDNWSLEDAATVPIAYATSYYALIMIGQLQKDESVLIHSGAEATGMAGISIALSLNCEVYTTVSTIEKKELLKNLFPKLKDENFGNSRDKYFEKIIRKRTKGRGVDVILNSLTGDLFEASVRCLAESGRFLDIGEEFLNRTSLESNLFLKGCGFHGIVFENLIKRGQSHIIQKLLKEGIKSGVVKPLPRTVFSETQVEEAFRFLAAGKRGGKVLIQIRNEESQVIKNPLRTIAAKPRIFFDPKKSYIIIGGLEGVGKELADWMIRKGARYIMLNSRRGITNGYQKICLTKWKQLEDVQVAISTQDSSNIQGAYTLISQAEKLAPIGGLFHSAVVLRDKLFTNQTEEDFRDVFKAKWNSVANLDKVTRQMCGELDHFVIFSSVTSAIGNPGQTNYGMANSAMDRLCEKRKMEGFPALAVQYGPIAEVGIMEHFDYEAIGLQYSELMSIYSCFNMLEKLMLQTHPVGETLVHINNEDRSHSNKERTVAETVAQILGIKDISTVNPTLTMVQFGMDSLMTAQMKQTLRRLHDTDVDIKTIQEMTFGDLFKMDELKAKPTVPKPNGTV